MAKPIPEGFHTVSPYLIVRGAESAIEFYKKAFGAQERVRMSGPDGKVAHAEIQVGDSIIMLSSEYTEMGARSPEAFNGTPVSLYLYVEDVDAAFAKAVDAGAKVQMPVQDMFWGDRYGRVVDPFGHEWQLATHKEDLTPEQISQRAAATFAQAPKPQ